MAPLEEIGQIRLELQNQFVKFEEDKSMQKEINAEIRRQFAAMRANASVEFEGSSYIPSTKVRDPFWYVFPCPHKQPKKKNIQSYFTLLTSASASQPSQT